MNCIVHGVTKRWTWMCNFHFTSLNVKLANNKFSLFGFIRKYFHFPFIPEGYFHISELMIIYTFSTWKILFHFLLAAMISDGKSIAVWIAFPFFFFAFPFIYNGWLLSWFFLSLVLFYFSLKICIGV